MGSQLRTQKEQDDFELRFENSCADEGIYLSKDTGYVKSKI
ncbi:hypothetical protein ACU8KH_03647 [Lachancea thermotolerans]